MKDGLNETPWQSVHGAKVSCKSLVSLSALSFLPMSYNTTQEQLSPLPVEVTNESTMRRVLIVLYSNTQEHCVLTDRCD